MNDYKIFPIPGINSNIMYGDEMFHIQTEVITSRKIVTTHIYSGGEIIHADFASFKKHYENLVTSEPEKLRIGITKLVKLMHQKGLKWLKENFTVTKEKVRPICTLKPLVEQWIISTIRNLKEDFPKINISAFVYNSIESKLENIKDEIKIPDYGDETIIVTLTLIVQTHIPNLFKTPTRLAYMETSQRKIFVIPLNSNVSGLIILDNNYPTGLIRMELKRYIPLLEKFQKPMKPLLPDPDSPTGGKRSASST